MMFSAFTDFASTLRNPWPIHITTNTWDYAQADQYQDQGQYVWFKHPGVNIREDFPLSWLPDDDQMFNIHAFPYCKERSKRVIRWDGFKLVPTNPDKRRHETKQKTIAGYDRNIYAIFFVASRDHKANEKFKAHKERFPQAFLIKNANSATDVCKTVLQRLFSKYAWIIDIDAEISNDFELFYEPPADATTTSYSWLTRSPAYSTPYASGAVMLRPYSYFKTLGASDEHQHIRIVDGIAGIVNNARNPMQAYTYAFKETVMPFVEYVEQCDYREAADFRLQYVNHNLSQYIVRGINDALEQIEEGNTDDLQSLDWIHNRFKSDQQLF